MAQISRFVTILVALFAILDAPFASAQDKTITVFAAASMKNALDDINAAFTRSTRIKVAASYAASSALMKQIEQCIHMQEYLRKKCWTSFSGRSDVFF